MTLNSAEFSRIHASSSAITTLVEISENFTVSGWEFEEWQYGDFLRYQDISENDLNYLIIDLDKYLKLHGFFIVSLYDLLERYTEDVAATSTTLLLSALGKPMRVFLDCPGHWRKVDVDLSRPANRSRGTGLLPLHMDFVNAENPPDLVCLLSIRCDPLGGGESLIARLDGIENMLSEHHLRSLCTPMFSDGIVHRLDGIGADINPFSVISQASRWQYRYTDNLLQSVTDREALSALTEMAQILTDRSVSFNLLKGDLLVIDQHRALHGRRPLGDGQNNIPSQERRLVLHSFVRVM